MIQVEHICTSGCVQTALQTWFNDHPDIILKDVKIIGYDVYIFYE